MKENVTIFDTVNIPLVNNWNYLDPENNSVDSGIFSDGSVEKQTDYSTRQALYRPPSGQYSFDAILTNISKGSVDDKFPDNSNITCTNIAKDMLNLESSTSFDKSFNIRAYDIQVINDNPGNSSCRFISIKNNINKDLIEVGYILITGDSYFTVVSSTDSKSGLLGEVVYMTNQISTKL